MKKVIVVTGASSGFGALAARALAKAGHVVYASMRDTSGRSKGQVQEATKFAADNKADLRTVELDVLSDTSANAAITKIIEDNGRLDVVVHNAGHMVFGPLEAFTPEQLAELYDVNVLSTQCVNRAALPQLRRQKQGLVVWVSSSSSAGGTPPYLARYFASTSRVAGECRDPARCLPVCIPVRRHGSSERHRLPSGSRNQATGAIGQPKSCVHGTRLGPRPRRQHGTNLDQEQPGPLRVRQESQS